MNDNSFLLRIYKLLFYILYIDYRMKEQIAHVIYTVYSIANTDLK